MDDSVEKEVTMAEQSRAEQPEEGSKGLAALFQEGVAAISTKRSNDLFKELDKRDLTVDEESIIKQRVEHQRRMLEEYERREESRKVRELVDVCGGNVTEEEAKYALKQFGGREDDAASALVSQGSFLNKVKNVVSGVPMPVAPSRAPRAPPGERKRPRGPTRPSVNQIQTLTSSSTCDANIFVGSFRGKLQPVAAGGCGRNNPKAVISEEEAAEAAEGSPSGDHPQGAAIEQQQQQPPQQEQPQDEGGVPAEAQNHQEAEANDDDVEEEEEEEEDPKPRRVVPVRRGRATRQRANPQKWGTIHGKIKAGEALDESAAAMAAAEKGLGETGTEEKVEVEPRQKAEEGEEARPEEEAKMVGGEVPRGDALDGSGDPQLTVHREASVGAEVMQQQQQQRDKEEEEEGAGKDVPPTADEPEGKEVAVAEGGSREGAKETCAMRSGRMEPEEEAVEAPIEAPVWHEGATAAAEEPERHVRTRRGQGGNPQAADQEEGDEKQEVKTPLPEKRSRKRSIKAASSNNDGSAEGGGGEDGGNPAAKGGKRKRKAAGVQRRPPKRPTVAAKAKGEAAAEAEDATGSGSLADGTSGCPGTSPNEARDDDGTEDNSKADEAAQAAGALSPPHPPAGPGGTTAASSPATAASDGPGPSSSEARSREPLRTLAVPINKPRLGRVKRCSSKKVDLIAVGSLKLERGWHNSGYIFPAGFKSRTIFRSSVDPTQLCVHECEIIGEGGSFWPAPTFRVVALDRPEWTLVAKSATGCWNAVLSRINAEIRRRIDAGEDWPPPPKTAIAGPEYFGLSHPAIVEQIEQLDPERHCASYWHGKQDREVCLSGGTPAARPAPPPPRPPRAAPAPQAPRPPKSTARPRGAGRGAARRAERAEPEDMEAMIASNRWSSLSRAERYRNRYGDAAAKEMAQDNPLPDTIDPITLEKVISPAISPYGHVMGHATWMAVLAEQGKCPFTQKPLRRDQITVLTKSNIERHRPAIVSL